MEKLEKQNFTRCMVKTSKHYYKSLFMCIGALIGGFIFLTILICALNFIANLLHWGDGVGTVLVLIVVPIDFIIVGCITFMVLAGDNQLSLIKFIKLFVKLHCLSIMWILLIGIDVICSIGIVCLFLIVMLIIVPSGFIYELIAGVFLIPVNLAAFKCFNIDKWTSGIWDKVIVWVNNV